MIRRIKLVFGDKLLVIIELVWNYREMDLVLVEKIKMRF